jgi:hypothetical protein
MEQQALKLGATALQRSWRKNKKIAVFYNGRWIHAGDIRYDDYSTHGDDERRESYRRRHEAIRLADGRQAYKVKEQPAYWAYHLLW